jgi:hypothetical protein
MKTIQTTTLYLHQGERLHPRLAYAVPNAVADGLVALGLATVVEEEPDIALPHLTWDSATIAAAQVSPAPLVNPLGGAQS